jgi:Icc-related predicted phosphoesterase
MLIRPVSDLHSEFWKYYKTDKILNMVIPPLPKDKETVLVIAGDFGLEVTTTWKQILELLSERFLLTICISGNHFFYNSDKFDRLQDIIKEIKIKNVCFLENHFTTIKLKDEEEVMFICSNLWTDFNKRDPLVMFGASKIINDFIKIRKSDNSVLTPDETVDLFDVSKKYIFKLLKHRKNKKTVVVTHHGISSLSIADCYKYNDLNPVYITDLSNEIIDNGPTLWIHGHVHRSADYIIGDTRVIVNPYGYKDHDENPDYQKDLVIEV